MLYSCPDFYPRSPCGERQTGNASGIHTHWISIHALLAESDRAAMPVLAPRFQFLSTLSLRRATVTGSESQKLILHFYPRSPCGERPAGNKAGAESFKFLSTLSLRRATINRVKRLLPSWISIHALLAESDTVISFLPSRSPTFLSTLSLRRATRIHSTSGGRPGISIHALLAESD